MTRAFLALSLIALAGCQAAKKPAAAKVQPPPGYTQNGYCIPDGVNAQTKKADFLICKDDKGEVTTYKRQ